MLLYGRLSLLFYFLLFFWLGGSIFFNSVYFTDSQIIPKWYWAGFSSILILLVLSVIYLIRPNTNLRNILKINILFFIVLSLCLIQALYGWGQWLHIFRSYNNFPVCGSFDNPAGFSACLSIGFPFILYFLRENRKQIKIISIISLFIISGAIIISGSRSGVFSLVIVFSLWLNRYSLVLKQWKGRVKTILSCSLIVVFFICLYYLRTDSANGRVLIWKNTWSMFMDNPTSGLGYKAFQSKYMLYQADYFAQYPQSNFVQLADNVNHPFNEYLLILAEFGIIGIISLSTIVFFLLYSYRRSPNSISFKALLLLVAIAVLSFFSYPLRYPFSWLILLLSIGILIQNGNLINIRKKSIRRLLASILFFVSILFSFKLYYSLQAELEWNRIAKKSLYGETEMMLSRYKEVKKLLQDNPLFLYNYSVELNVAKKYKESLLIAEECEKLYNDYDLQLLKADNLMNLNQYYEAEKYYYKASCMCPNRFVPLYYLFQIMNQTNRKDEAQKLGEMILRKKVKFSSETIDLIKEEIRNNLKKECL